MEEDVARMRDSAEGVLLVRQHLLLFYDWRSVYFGTPNSAGNVNAAHG